MKEVEHGKAPCAKVVVLHSHEQVVQLQKMIIAHGLKCKFPALFQESVNLGTCEIVRKTQQYARFDETSISKLVTFKVVALGEGVLDFADQAPIAVSKAPAQKIDLATFRVTVLESVIATPKWKMWLLKPAACMREWCGPSYHSSFAWRRTTFKGAKDMETVLEGMVKVRQDQAITVDKTSGQHGVFSWNVCAPKPLGDNQCFGKVQVSLNLRLLILAAWLLKNGQWHVEKEVAPSLATGVRVSLLGHAYGSSLVLQSCGGKMSSPPCSRKPAQKNIEVHGAPRRGKKGFWKIKMQASFDDGSGIHTVLVDDTILTLSYLVPIAPSETRKFVAPGSLRPFKPVVPTAETGAEKHKATEEAPQDPEQQPAKAAKKALPFELVECGGNGRCGFNSVATAMALRNGSNRKEALEAADAQGAQLRVVLSCLIIWNDILA